MLERASRPASRPHAEQRPVRSIRHGVECVDEFAWLRAANWQAVMRDPRLLDPEIRSYPKARLDLRRNGFGVLYGSGARP